MPTGALLCGLGDGKRLTTTVVTKPTDYVFRRGHRIALLVATSSVEWTLPKAYDGAPGSPAYSLELGSATTLTLPLAGETRGLFAP